MGPEWQYHHFIPSSTLGKIVSHDCWQPILGCVYSRGTHNQALDRFRRQIKSSKRRCKSFPRRKIEIKRSAIFWVISFLKMRLLWDFEAKSWPKQIFMSRVYNKCSFWDEYFFTSALKNEGHVSWYHRFRPNRNYGALQIRDGILVKNRWIDSTLVPHVVFLAQALLVFLPTTIPPFQQSCSPWIFLLF